MIQYTTGNILDADAQALVNTVNCVGVMGRGIALQFRKVFPGNFEAYRIACGRDAVRPGAMFVYDLGSIEGPRYIINFPTKRHWKGKSRIEDIESGLTALVQEVQSRKIQSIAVPPLGCGLGGLEWTDVRPLIEAAFAAVPEVQVVVFEPAGAPAAHQMPAVQTPPPLTVGRAALLGLVNRYLTAVMDPVVSLLEIHKLMYFMQESGESLRLDYQKAYYGPYSQNLRHVLNLLEGHFISGFGDGEDSPTKPIEIKQGASEAAEEFLLQHKATHERFQRVVDLISGFETPYGMELLATVHWVATRQFATDSAAAVRAVHAWSERKQMFPERHIELAWNVLRSQSWLAQR